MDINQWLRNTSAADEDRLAQRVGIPSFLQRANRETPSSPPKHKRRRERSPTRASSLLEAAVPPPQDASNAHQPLPLRDLEEQLQGGDSHVSHQRSSSISSGAYKRRPRRKTRADRYNAAPKSHEKRCPSLQGEDRDGGSRKRKRRRRVEKPGVGVVQTFQAKNIVKDRLTFKPNKNVGLFRNGRASSPRRGRGLPDLVFSEMKFLQKPREPSGEPLLTTVSRNERKKKQEKARDEEVSTYFGAKRQPLAERNANAQLRRPATKPPNDSRVVLKESSREQEPHAKHAQEEVKHSMLSVNSIRGNETSSSAAKIVPTTELPSGPDPDFGSRSNGASAASYYTWPESSQQVSTESGILHRGGRRPAGRSYKGSAESIFRQSRRSRPASRGKVRSTPGLNAHFRIQEQDASIGSIEDHFVQATTSQSSPERLTGRMLPSDFETRERTLSQRSSLPQTIRAVLSERYAFPPQLRSKYEARVANARPPTPLPTMERGSTNVGGYETRVRTRIPQWEGPSERHRCAIGPKQIDLDAVERRLQGITQELDVQRQDSAAAEGMQEGHRRADLGKFTGETVAYDEEFDTQDWHNENDDGWDHVDGHGVGMEEDVAEAEQDMFTGFWKPNRLY
ncbi:MAG: hypothetical protein M1820_008479 [Bogoriella megaspora]|nr:MAG: hypothetical protein M1820_008479 [Bogoriella megaspora]